MENLEHSEGMSIPCPYDPEHFVIHRYTKFNGMELLHCHQCGYRYILMKQGGKKLLIDVPEQKGLKRRAGR